MPGRNWIKTKLGELIDLFSFNLGNKEARAQDILGRVYEYFLGKFGSSGGEFYTPPTIVKLLVGMIEPYKGFSKMVTDGIDVQVKQADASYRTEKAYVFDLISP